MKLYFISCCTVICQGSLKICYWNSYGYYTIKPLYIPQFWMYILEAQGATTYSH